jgi:predicted RecB family nuclease
LKNPEDPFMVELARTGIQHEANGQQHLIDSGKAVVIECSESTTVKKLHEMIEGARKKRFAVIIVDDSTRGEHLAQTATHALCESPEKVQVIWNAHLRPWRKVDGRYEWGTRSGKPDALVRAAKAGGTWRWDPVDYKAHRVLERSGKSREWKTSLLVDHANSTNVSQAGPFKKSDAMQLAHYVRMLEFHDLAGSGSGGIVGTDNGQDLHQIIWMDLNEKAYDRNRMSALEMYDEKFSEAHAVAEQAAKRREDVSVEAITRPEWKSECKTCVWREHCNDRLVDVDDTTLLAGLTVDAARKLRGRGISTVADLARLDIPTAKVLDSKVSGLDTLVGTARELRHLATSPVGTVLPGTNSNLEDVLVGNGICTVGALAQLDIETAAMPDGIGLVDHIDQARVVDYARRKKMTHIFRARGVPAVCIPRGNVEVHTDMEEDGIIYMWGNYLSWRSPNGKVRTSYHPFVTFERDDNAEAKVFAEYWAFLNNWRAQAAEKFGEDTFKVYHYTQAEDRCMRHIVKKHAGVEGIPTLEELEAFLSSDEWVDLYPLLTKSLVWPCDDHSLKSLAKYVRFMWRDSDPSGAASTLWFQKACDTTLSDKERAVWQKRILQYNEDDVMATAALVEFVDRFTKVYDPAKKLPPVEDLEPRYRRTTKRIA